MGAKIAAIEYYLPQTVLSNEELYGEFPDWPPDKIEQKLGIRKRHIAGNAETSLDLARHAARKLIDIHGTEGIDYLLLCTQSPDYWLPTSACLLQDQLNLSPETAALDFNLGCSGFVYGLSLAKGLINSNQARKVLLITAETYSKFIHPKDKANRTIFGDGAAATLIESSPDEHIFNFSLGTDGSGWKNLIVPNGGMRNRYDPDAAEATDGGGSVRTENHLFMNGPEIFNFTIRTIPRLVENVLLKNNLSQPDIDYFVLHQANKYMLDYLRQKLKIPVEKFYLDMAESGNTVSATVPVALKNCFDHRTVKEGNLVMLCGFGVGYSWGATIIKI